MKQWVIITLCLLGTLFVSSRPISAYPAQPKGIYSGDKAWLGVVARDLSFDRLEFLKLEYGARVAEVAPDSPAEKAGLQEGDIILELDQKPAYSARRLSWLVSHVRAGEEISLRYYRDGNFKTVSVQLQSPEAPSRRYPSWDMWRWLSLTYLGVDLQVMTEDLRTHFGAPRGVGVLIARVFKGSPADEAGMVAGDVIIKMDRKTIYRIADIHRVLNFFDPGDEIAVEIVRENKRKTITVTLAKSPGPDLYGKGYKQGDLPYEVPAIILDPRFWQEEIDKALEKWKEFWQEKREYHFDDSL